MKRILATILATMIPTLTMSDTPPQVLRFIDSLRLISGNVSLVNDSASPGNSLYYGTNSLGFKGYYPFASTAWGSITGTLSNQTDLQSALNAKQDTLTEGNLTEATSSVLTISGGTSSVIGSGTSIQVKQSSTAQSGYLSNTDWNTFNGKQASGNYVTALTGDGSATGPGSASLTLATVNTNTGSFGSASASPAFTVNGKGLITAASATSIQIAESQVTNLVSDLAGKQAVGNYLTALSSDVVATGPGSAAATIQSNVVSNSKLAQMGANTVKANTTASTANASDVALGTVTELTSSVLTLAGWTDATIGSPTILVKQAATAQSGYLSSTDWNTFNGKQAAGNYVTALTGDGTASGPGSAALTLATVNSNTGSFGSASSSPAFTVNGKGLITAASATSIQIAESQVTNLVTDLAGKQATGNYITALTGDVTASGPGSVASTLASSISGAKTFSTSLTSPIFSSSTANPASAGAVRLANADAIEFRNAANSGNLLLQPGSADAVPQYNSIDLVNLSTAQTLSNKTISGSSNTLTNIADGSLTTSYLKADGTRALTGSWSAGAFQVAFAGGTPASTALVTVGPSSAQNPIATATQRAFRATMTATSAATTSVVGYSSQVATAAAAFTVPLRAQFEAVPGSVGAGSTVTNDVLYYANGAPTGGAANAILSDNSAFSGNWGINLSSANANLLTGATAIGGTATNNNAAAGFVGEYIESVISSTTSIPGTTGQYGNLTSVALTAGDWEMNGLMSLDNANGASITTFAGAISVNSGNTTTDQVDGSNQADSATPGSGAVRSIGIPGYRLSLSGPTTVYLKMAVGFTVATPQYRCRLSARRMR